MAEVHEGLRFEKGWSVPSPPEVVSGEGAQRAVPPPQKIFNFPPTK